MKILLINKFYYLKGGSERVFFDTKKVLEKNGYQTAVFSMKDERNEESPYSKYFIDNVDFNSLKGLIKSIGLFYSFKTQKKLENLIKTEKPDIAHLHNAYYQISPSIFKILKKYKIPVVLTAHDYHLACPNYKLFTKGKPCERCRKHKYYNAVLYKCLDDKFAKSLFGACAMSFNKIFQFYEKNVDAVLAPSKFMADKLASFGFPKQKLQILPYGIDTEIFKPIPDIKKEYVLYFGRFSQEKGINILIDAMKDLDNVKLKLMGDGPLKPDLDKIAAQNSNIEMLPYKPLSKINEIVEIINKAKCVVVPSLWYENYPMAVLEALACGTAVIGSDVGGIPELVQDNQNGCIFTAGNAKQLSNKINMIYNDNELSIKMGRNARKSIMIRNSMKLYFYELMKVYKSLLDNK